MYCQILLLLIVWSVNSLADPPKCKLCERSNLSCSKQVKQSILLEEDCTMVYYPLRSPECSSSSLLSDDHGFDLGNVRLQSYIYSEGHLGQTAFNVSFSNISWSSLSMRFMQNSAPEENTCRDFYVSETFLSLKESQLFYDCLWSNSGYEEKTYNFEYTSRNSLSSQYHKYVFIVPRGDRINPNETNISKWEVFMYVDISSSQTVILKAQTTPKQFNVTKYLVKVHRGTYEDSVIKDEKIIIAEGSDDEITYPWSLGILHGSYYFTVQPLSESCPGSKCLISKSPVITISIPYNPIYAGVVLAAASLLILLCFCFKIFGSKGHESSSQPSLLLIYQSTHTSHIRVVVELAKYLRKNCNIHAMVDELDVNRSKSQDPFDWYNGATSGADFIAVVSSPTCCNSINGIYPKAYDAALCFLRGSAFKRENFAKKCKLMVFMLPYGSKKHLPVETKNIGLHFQIPSHLMDLSHYIHNFKEMYFFERYYYFVRARAKFLWNFIKYKNCVDNACDWPELQKAIQEANLEIKKCEKNRGIADLKVDFSQQTRDIFLESAKETVALGDSLVMDSSTPPLDNASVFAEYPIPLDNIDLLGLKIEEVDIENPDSRDDPLDNLQL